MALGPDVTKKSTSEGLHTKLHSWTKLSWLGGDAPLVPHLPAGCELARFLGCFGPDAAGFGGYCFKPRDAQLVAKLCGHGAFADAPQGVRLDMSMGHLGAIGAAALAEAVGAGLVLRELHLDDAHLTDGGCVALASALGAARSRVRLLESLSLRRDGIGDSGAAALASLLATAAPNALRCLRLGKNPIGFDGIEVLRLAVEQCSPPSQPIELELDPPVTRVGRPEQPARRERQDAESSAQPSRRPRRRRQQPPLVALGINIPPSVVVPPPPTPQEDLITRILRIRIRHDGAMTVEEAARLLLLTDKRPKWLLAQVHPDKHPGRQSEAVIAAARVNQAIDVRGSR